LLLESSAKKPITVEAASFVGLSEEALALMTKTVANIPRARTAAMIFFIDLYFPDLKLRGGTGLSQFL
jgi:hypothetical protein